MHLTTGAFGLPQPEPLAWPVPAGATGLGHGADRSVLYATTTQGAFALSVRLTMDGITMDGIVIPSMVTLVTTWRAKPPPA